MPRTTAARRARVSAARLEQIEDGEESPTLDELDGLSYAYKVPTLALLAYYDLCTRDSGDELFELIFKRSPRELRSAKRILQAIFDDYRPEKELAPRKPRPVRKLKLARSPPGP